jgi:uncharacterized membrane protein
MDETARLIIAVLVAPVFLVLLQGRQRRHEQQANWAREDAVAAQAAAAARLLLEQQEHTAALLVANNESVAAATGHTHRELGEIRVLVNGELTGALQQAVRALELAQRLQGQLLEFQARVGGGQGRDRCHHRADRRAALADRGPGPMILANDDTWSMLANGVDKVGAVVVLVFIIGLWIRRVLVLAAEADERDRAHAETVTALKAQLAACEMTAESWHKAFDDMAAACREAERAAHEGAGGTKLALAYLEAFKSKVGGS